MPPSAPAEPRYCVAVIGGATAGAEVAGLLAERGCLVVVFEQNDRPYGKIEDGLPRWHEALRHKEYASIDARLAQPGVHFVPRTRVGRDVDFAELANDWGFNAVVLACGAWRDRPLPVEGADAFLGKGLVYQNPFIIWFNHSEEAGYDGPRFEPRDGALVVGGGLASIDVAKVLMLENARAALARHGIEVGILDLEVKGIPKTCQAHGLAVDDLALEGCTIFYRRRIQDMPVVEMPDGASPERQEKIRTARARLLDKAMDKYRFRMEPLCMPDGLLVEDGRLVGLRFRRTRMEAGRPVPTDETFERRGSMVISSIGSIPEPIAGIEMKGELFRFSDWDTGRIEAYPTVFSAGNVVTGKGNIVASRKHAAQVEAVVERFLGLGEEGHAGEEAAGDAARAAAREDAVRVARALESQEPAAPGVVARILERVAARQREVGCDAGYRAWIEKVTPADMA